MSLTSKKRRSAQRKEAKRKVKAANQAKYAAWAAAGVNSKRKRSKAATKKLARTGRHLNGRCGNIGCGKCNPSDYNLR